jgi:putative transmembrane protein
MQAAWMLAAAFFFSSMGVCVKYAAAHFTPLEIIFYRGLFGMLFTAALVRMRGVPLATRWPWAHAWRNVVGVGAMSAWFYAMAHLPLATAMTLNYMSSVWIAVFVLGGALLMRRWDDLRAQWPLALTVAAGFAGVVLILRPAIAQDEHVAGLIGLASGMLAAMAYMQVAALGRLGEPETRTVFYFSLGSALAGAAATCITGWHGLNTPDAWWLLPVGLLAVLGQLCLTRAYTRSATMLVANLQYSGIVFAALYGVALFGEYLPLTGWLGIILITASGMAASLWRKRLRLKTAAPPRPAT